MVRPASWVGLVIGTLVLLGCATSPIPFDGKTAPLRKLSGDEIRTLITGKTLLLDITATDTGNVEYFSPSGGWRESGGMVALSGAYRITRDSVCVIRQIETCRNVFKTREGYLIGQQPYLVRMLIISDSVTPIKASPRKICIVALPYRAETPLLFVADFKRLVALRIEEYWSKKLGQSVVAVSQRVLGASVCNRFEGDAQATLQVGRLADGAEIPVRMTVTFFGLSRYHEFTATPADGRAELRHFNKLMCIDAPCDLRPEQARIAAADKVIDLIISDLNL